MPGTDTDWEVSDWSSPAERGLRVLVTAGSV